MSGRRVLPWHLALLMCSGLLLRVGVAVLLVSVLQEQEFADDFIYYRAMTAEPWALLLGEGPEEIRGWRIYAPLVPVQVGFSNRCLLPFVDFSLAQRLAMIAWDVAAVAIALCVAFSAGGWPKGWRQWLVAGTFACLPVSVLASSVWGQEDSLASLWAALALLAWWRGRAVVASAIGGLGLFTYKLFSPVLVAGIWIGERSRRWRIALAAGTCLLAFMVFLGLRWLHSGLFWPTYHYNPVHNSPSPWAAWSLLVEPVMFSDIRAVIMVVTVVVLGLWVMAAARRRLSVPVAVVGTHAVFFSVFVGIQPEHHQWFAPFLIYLAWVCYRAGHRLMPLACWGYGILAYGYKVAYGLQGTGEEDASGKAIFRQWFASHVGIDLFWVQIVLLFATLGCGVVLAWLCLVQGSDDRRGDGQIPLAGGQR